MPFQALTTYYISPTGNDSNSGTSPATAWATPKHAVNCGDVLIAAPGAYNSDQFGANNWGTVSACPSTTGGIDGKGGVYFAVLLCGGPGHDELHGRRRRPGGRSGSIRRTGRSKASRRRKPATASRGRLRGRLRRRNVGDHARPCTTSHSSTTLPAAATPRASTATRGPGRAAAWTSTRWSARSPTTRRPARAAQGSAAAASRSSRSNGPDTSAGTHVFVAGAFSYKNINAPRGAGCNTDGEGLIFDSWGVQPYAYQAVAEQNVFWGNGGPGLRGVSARQPHERRPGHDRRLRQHVVRQLPGPASTRAPGTSFSTRSTRRPEATRSPTTSSRRPRGARRAGRSTARRSTARTAARRASSPSAGNYIWNSHRAHARPRPAAEHTSVLQRRRPGRELSVGNEHVRRPGPRQSGRAAGDRPQLRRLREHHGLHGRRGSSRRA